MGYTVGDIARKLGRSQHSVVYAIQSAGVEAAARAGIIRLFTDAQIVLIEAELARIARKHGKEPADELEVVRT